MKRLLVALGVSAIAFSGAYGAAASVGFGPLGLGSGAGAVTSCDSDGVTTTYTTGFDATAGYTVTQATVSGINSSCAGLSVRVTLSNSANTSVGSGGPVTVPGGGGSVNVAISGTIAVTTIANVHVEID